MPDVLDTAGRPLSQPSQSLIALRTISSSLFQGSLMDGFFERVVLKALSGMTQGYMKMVLPDGQCMTFGQPDAIIQASIRILDPLFFRKCVLYGDIGFGES